MYNAETSADRLQVGTATSTHIQRPGRAGDENWLVEADVETTEF